MRRGGLAALLGIALAVSSEAGAEDDLARELPRIKPLEPAAAIGSFRIHAEKVKRCQEPKNDFLASTCPKWVPDTLSALSRAEPVNVRFYSVEQQALPRSCIPLPLPSRLLAPTTGLRHDQRISPFPSPHRSKNRPTLTWKSPSRSGMVNSSSAPSKRVVPSAR